MKYGASRYPPNIPGVSMPPSQADEHLLEPMSDVHGRRTARQTFGSMLHPDLEDLIDAEFEESLEFDFDDELDDDDEFGAYEVPPRWRWHPVSPWYQAPDWGIIEQDEIDDLVMDPRSSSGGSRGARPSFGAAYKTRPYGHKPADPMMSTLTVPRSGSGGHRGGRPSFGAQGSGHGRGGGSMHFSAGWGPYRFQYTGGALGAAILALFGAFAMWRTR